MRGTAQKRFKIQSLADLLNRTQSRLCRKHLATLEVMRENYSSRNRHTIHCHVPFVWLSDVDTLAQVRHDSNEMGFSWLRCWYSTNYATAENQRTLIGNNSFALFKCFLFSWAFVHTSRWRCPNVNNYTSDHNSIIIICVRFRKTIMQWNEIETTVEEWVLKEHSPFRTCSNTCLRACMRSCVCTYVYHVGATAI